MIVPKVFALKNSTTGSICSPCSYHSGTRPRNSDQVHLKLITILGGINWSYKKQEIVEIALLLSRQNIDARFGFKWKRDSAGWGLSKQILEAIKNWEMEKNIIKRWPWEIYKDAIFLWFEFYVNFMLRALRLELLRKTVHECIHSLERSQHLSHQWSRFAKSSFPCIPERCRFASSVSSKSWRVRASFTEIWSKL